MDYIQINITVSSKEESDILVAELSNIGFDGFEEDENMLKAFIAEANFIEDLFENFIKLNSIKYYKSIVKEENWNKNWESGFKPVIVYDSHTKKPLVQIRSHFHNSNSEIPYDLLITPKMSFGTGHHATTYLMIEQLSLLDLKDKSVVDFGTGTGILAIFSEKLGAASIV
ncbi:MAG: 50S ribosomal protein L11 methyltransferase, partial [Ferruginibacter sp.]|nr:50S ribosomal protein L11 methyltransferase [Ferruginibacter sp.]